MIWKILLSLYIGVITVLAFIIPIGFIPGLGERARIIFLHVPSAWLSVIAFFVSMLYGIRYLKSKDIYNDIKSVASAEIGFLFCFITTITGSIWAKFNWGSFWNWDPRETSIFVLLLIYGAYFVLRSAIEIEERKATLSAVYSIIAFVTVPFFIFIMPRIMPGLHPGSKGDPEGAGPVVSFKMDPNMRILFFASLIGFTLVYLWIFSLRSRTEILKIKIENKIYREVQS
ncbi:heme exporter protein C [Candidatus Kryptobacter tengchongensis]|uniref:Heme exporter protein C n=1 Tax=Kryptobacter tengchongensis TaxID=1643429 RepID=A0A656DC50_KRYT1|nr:cytochrome c biogenesis protein CcsA [Candidatus Kryptobacter tengchongensis]CUS86341.1 heme exporter protein C [Candidatus Kryptobacter tengchongensis]CUT04465.1 heme exporter protein C [Candidatus Kryptobacter tengchongensis]CUU09444.1 heme exporter protein C [Candidatus Kryptobacter tengchongensis]